MPVNAIDFSDLTGIKEKIKPQGFQDNSSLSEPSSDNLEKHAPAKAMGYPTQQTPAGDELMQLFPTPLLICPYPVNYDKELEYIRNATCKRENKGGGNDCAPGGLVQHYNRQSDNTFILDEPELANIRAFIEAKLHEYVTKIMASDDKLAITQSWLNKSKKGESHHEHVHPNSMISGVWYPQIHEQMPPIQFRSRQQRDVSLQTEKFNTLTVQHSCYQ